VFETSKQPASIGYGGSACAAVKKPTVTELHLSAEMAAALLESAAQAVIGTDGAGRIVLANRQAQEMFGYTREDFLASSIEMLLPEAKLDTLAQMRGEDLHPPGVRPMTSGTDLSGRRKDGSVFPLEVGLSHIETAEGVFTIAFVTDISQRRHLEQQLMQAQRTEAIGRLAGGMAHDFNNMLTVILGYGSMVLEELQAQNKSRSHVEEIVTATNRAAALTGQVLAFSRQNVQQRLRPQVINLNTLIADTGKMLRRLIREDIVLDMVLEAGLGNVQADPGQVEQAIVNLVVNARDAIPAAGRIAVETANVCLDESYAKTRSGVQPGEFVMLAVSDTGHGMDTDVQRRVFEPFFTTKEHGKGTGLGLASVYSMVKQTGGDIRVDSEPGKGTTFKLYFPRVPDPITASRSVTFQPAWRGHETILVVEDEPWVRDITVKMVEQLGYTALFAASGAEALELSNAHSGTIDLLLTDVVMPGMNGRQLANQLAGTRPDMKVLYFSGYTSVALCLGVVDSSVAFLAKPFSRDALAKTMREVLENRRNQ
jgi:two-component system cell cycle sensor histidine kinase/response regulator CckA